MGLCNIIDGYIENTEEAMFMVVYSVFFASIVMIVRERGRSPANNWLISLLNANPSLTFPG